MGCVAWKDLTLDFPGFVAGAITTGTLRGAAIGAFSGAMFAGIGDKFAGKVMDFGARVSKTLLHGIAGGIGSVLSGGKFGHGFASAGFTQAASLGGRTFVRGDTLGNAFKAAVIGGTASTLTGGKFSNGAMTGAFSRALNERLHDAKNGSIIRYMKAGVKGVASAVGTAAGVVAVGACIVAEPCGVIAWAGGASLVVAGSVGAVDTVIELDNIKNGTNHLPVMERLGEGFGGSEGQQVGKNIQIAVDVVNITRAGAGAVSTLEVGGKLNGLHALDAANTIDDLKQ